MDCLKCKFIKIESNNPLPYTCTKFGFSTNTYPSIRVLNMTGVKCPFFVDNHSNISSNKSNKTIIRESGDINYEA